jgi:protein-S-isoprenylcysteine O-methyltransferase Ste14
MNSEFLLFVSLFVIGLTIRAGYELLKKAGRIKQGNLVVNGIVFVAMFLLWISWFRMCPTDPLPLALPAPLRWLGFAIVLVGLGLAIGAAIQLRGVLDINHLVTTGLFAKIRHPMYAGFILWIVGWALYYGAAVSLLFGLIGLGNILYWRQREDEELALQFGEDYQRYRRQTWF